MRSRRRSSRPRINSPRSRNCSPVRTRLDGRRTATCSACAASPIRAPDLVVAGDPAAHVFAFQGATDVPILRFTERFADAVHQPLETWHRSPGGMPVAEAWLAAHTSEEHGAIARELRRLHVQDG